MRLIDADKLEALFEDQVMRGQMDVFAAFDDALQDAQTVDAVPVVRCRECKYSRELNAREKEIFVDSCRTCENPDASQHGYMIVFPDHFCSYGERMESNENNAPDRLTLCATAAIEAGMSSGKYMAKYGYNPPVLRREPKPMDYEDNMNRMPGVREAVIPPETGGRKK